MDNPSATHWFVIHTHRRQELRVEQNLHCGGIEVFLPKISEAPARRSTQSAKIAPLFPQYVFARFDPAHRLHDVLFTRGVQAPVLIGGTLAAVEDGAIGFLQSRVRDDGLIRVGRTLQRGEKVVIESGPFADWIGVVERYSSEHERVVVLLSTVSAALRVDVQAVSIRRLA